MAFEQLKLTVSQEMHCLHPKLLGLPQHLLKYDRILPKTRWDALRNRSHPVTKRLHADLWHELSNFLQALSEGNKNMRFCLS